MKHLHGQVMHRNRKPQIYCTSAFRIRFFVSLHFHCLVHIKQKQILTGVHWFPSFQNTPAGLAEFPTFFYRTENHEFLLLFNYPEEFEPDIYIKQSYEYFKQRHNCTVFWGISRPCVSLSEFIFAKKEALTALSFSLTDSHNDITVYSDQLFFTAENADRCFYPQTAADLLIKGIKTNNIDLIRFILTVLEDENTRLRSFSPGQMIAGANAYPSYCRNCHLLGSESGKVRFFGTAICFPAGNYQLSG